MTRVVLCGTGNVARHLFDAFIDSDKLEVVQVAGRSVAQLHHFASHTTTTTDFNRLEKADVYILAVTDSAIEKLSQQIGSGFLVHTSGATSIEKLPVTARRGVFYPLQTFSKDLKVDFSEIPICLEAESDEDYIVLETLAKAISNKIVSLNSGHRFILHTAAVFVNNFSNHLWTIGHELCEQEGLAPELLQPLILETANKTRFLSPYNAQTGPARRNDALTIHRQIEALEKESHKIIYKSLTKSIQETHAKEL